MKVIEIIRAIVRPYIAVGTVTIILSLTFMLISKFGDADMAKQVITFVLAAGATVVGFYFGERAKKK